MRTLKWLDENFEKVFLVLFSTIMVVVIFLQVFMRYVMQNSLPWSEELARYCAIWLVYIGISYGVKKQRHISVDIAFLLLKDRGKLILQIIANILFLSFAIFVALYGYDTSARLLEFGQKSPANQIPMGLVYLAAPVGMALAGIRIVQNLILQFQSLFSTKSTLVNSNIKANTEIEQL